MSCSIHWWPLRARAPSGSKWRQARPPCILILEAKSLSRRSSGSWRSTSAGSMDGPTGLLLSLGRLTEATSHASVLQVSGIHAERGGGGTDFISFLHTLLQLRHRRQEVHDSPDNNAPDEGMLQSAAQLDIAPQCPNTLAGEVMSPQVWASEIPGKGVVWSLVESLAGTGDPRKASCTGRSRL